MGTTNTNAPVRYARQDDETRAERKRIFLEELAKHGVLRYAAAAASGHIVARNGYTGKSNCGVETFARWMREEPEFAEQVRAAQQQAVGVLEKTLIDRTNTPNIRPVFDKQGNHLGDDVNWQSANQLLLRALERHDPHWVQKKDIGGTQTIIHTDAATGGGAAYVVKPADVMLLPEDRRALLMELLLELEDVRGGDAAGSPAVAALPGPGGGSDAV